MERGPRVVVAALVKNPSGEILLVKEPLEDNQEWWILPGGGVKFGESLEAAVKRELMEELELKLSSVKLLGFKEVINPKLNYHTIVFFFEAETVEEPKPAEKGIKEARFFRPEELKNLKLVDSARWAVERFLEGVK